MKYVLILESAAQFAAAVFFLHQLPFSYPWYIWLMLFFLPDLGMIGYLINTQIGALTYNLCHHLGIALAFVLAGVLMHDPRCTLIGAILFAHASFDRILGYGLKYGDSFKHTHLGDLGV